MRKENHFVSLRLVHLNVEKFTAAMSVFFHMFRRRATFFLVRWVCLPGLWLFQCRPSCWPAMLKAGSLGFIWSAIFMQMKLIIFALNGLSCLTGQTHIISSLLIHFCLFQNVILQKMLKLGFWNFTFIFFRM